jgi:regulatory protein
LNEKEVIKAIRRAAMNALARREHTIHELGNKLSPRFPLHKHIIPAVLQQLSDDGLQSDQRFAEAYIRWRTAKGYGVNRISMELAQKGVDEELLESAINHCGINWQQLLLEQFEKKYESQKPDSLEEKAKMQRFFQYRGFSNDQIKGLFKSL